MRRLLPLAAIEVFVWSILLLSTLIIAKITFAITIGTPLLTEISRNALSGVVIVVWLLVWKKVTDFYLQRTLSRRHATA